MTKVKPRILISDYGRKMKITSTSLTRKVKVTFKHLRDLVYIHHNISYLLSWDKLKLIDACAVIQVSTNYSMTGRSPRAKPLKQSDREMPFDAN